MKFDANGKREVWNIDLDGVLALGGPFWEQEPEPSEFMVDYVRELYQAGNVVIIWTARQWEYAPETVGWLIKHKVPFHGIYMGKGGADHYVDDKMTNPVVLDGDKPKFHWTGGWDTQALNLHAEMAEPLKAKLRAIYAETEKQHEQTAKEVMEILKPIDKFGVVGYWIAKAEMQRRLDGER